MIEQVPTRRLDAALTRPVEGSRTFSFSASAGPAPRPPGMAWVQVEHHGGQCWRVVLIDVRRSPDVVVWASVRTRWSSVESILHQLAEWRQLSVHYVPHEEVKLLYNSEFRGEVFDTEGRVIRESLS